MFFQIFGTTLGHILSNQQCCFRISWQ